jgi:hypothetical protein
MNPHIARSLRDNINPHRGTRNCLYCSLGAKAHLDGKPPNRNVPQEGVMMDQAWKYLPDHDMVQSNGWRPVIAGLRRIGGGNFVVCETRLDHYYVISIDGPQGVATVIDAQTGFQGSVREARISRYVRNGRPYLGDDGSKNFGVLVPSDLYKTVDPQNYPGKTVNDEGY